MSQKTLDRYEQFPVTKADRRKSIFPSVKSWEFERVGRAELITLDVSQYEQPDGKEALAEQLEHAVRHSGPYKIQISFHKILPAAYISVGFFYVKELCVKKFNISLD